MLVQANLKLFLPGHASWNQLKQAFFPFETYVPPSQKDWGPNGTSVLTLRIWSFAIAIWKVMHSKFPMIGLSCSFWKNTVLTGESGSTTTSNPLCSYQVPHSLSRYVCDAIRLALELSYPDVLHWWTGKCPTCSFPFIHDTLLTWRTLWNFISRSISTTLGSVHCSFRGFRTSGLTIRYYYYYYSLARLIYIFLIPQPLVLPQTHFLTVSPMEHKRDATVAGLVWPSNPNRGLTSTTLDPVSDGQASELCHSITPAPATSTTSAPSAADTTTNDIGTTPHTDTYSGPALPDVPFSTEPSPTYNFFHRAPFSSRVVHQIHFKIITHSNNTRELFIEEIPMSGLSKCRDPEHYFYGLSGNWEWSCALRIIGAITLRFL